ncbi:hypothetical protein GCM10027596_04950 [Nocardioides korecus]
MTQASSPRTGYAAAVLGWADHVAAGGRTPWADWAADPPAHHPASTDPLPTSPQLELLRRLVARAGGPVPGLAERVLTTSLPGRGLVDVPLPWPERPRFGSAPVDPADVGVEELLRVAGGLLVHLLPGVRLPRAEPAPPPRRSWRPRSRRPQFRVHGPTLAADVVRRDLLAAGWAEGDRRPHHLVVGLPLDGLAALHWDTTTRRGSRLRWTTLWRRWRSLDRLPTSVDVAATADGVRRACPQDRVSVVLGRDLADLRVRTAEGLGLPAPTGPAPHPPDPRAADLRRRLNPALRLAASPGHRSLGDLREALALALDATADGPAAGRALGVPPRSRAWARREAARVAADLRAADYPVLGDPGLVGDLAPSTDPTARGVGLIDPDSTLELALVACLRAWRLQEGRD